MLTWNESCLEFANFWKETKEMFSTTAIHEACECAFVEAHGRVECERIVVKATKEVRQRILADACEKVAKASL